MGEASEYDLNLWNPQVLRVRPSAMRTPRPQAEALHFWDTLRSDALPTPISSFYDLNLTTDLTNC